MISDKATKCPKCGTPIKVGTMQKTGNEVTPAASNYQKDFPPTAKRSNNTVLFVIIGIIAVALIGLGYFLLKSDKNGDQEKEQLETQADSNEAPSNGKEELVKERLRQIYEEVFSKYDDDDLSNDGPEDNDARWLTTEFKDLLKREKEVTPEGELGYIDYNHWIQAQDYEKPSMTIESVEMISDTKAISKIKVMPFSNSAPENVKVTLKYERNNWYIDDFSSSLNVSEKEGLKEYITDAAQTEGDIEMIDTTQSDTIPIDDVLF